MKDECNSALFPHPSSPHPGSHGANHPSVTIRRLGILADATTHLTPQIGLLDGRDLISTEERMYIIREVLNCKPGKVRPLIDRFQILSAALEKTGRSPIRLLTDVTGEQFWTLIAEVTVPTVDDFFTVEESLMADESVRNAMAGYHELVERGRREVYRVMS